MEQVVFDCTNISERLVSTNATSSKINTGYLLCGSVLSYLILLNGGLQSSLQLAHLGLKSKLVLPCAG